MNTRLLKLFSLFLPAISTCAHAQFSDGFSDGNFSADPAWQGMTSLFTVNGSLQLQTNGPAQTDTAVLSIPFTPDFGDTITWEFYWKMAFAPSDNNTGRVYLSSSLANPTNTANTGYYLRIGNSGNDSLRFYRLNGSSSALLATGVTDYSNNPGLSVKVIRFPNGNWEIYSDPAAGNNYLLESAITDNTYTSGGYFSLWCKYTSSNSTKFYFDDFDVQGSVYSDSDPPVLSSVSVGGANELFLTFNEPLDPITSTAASNYVVNNGVGTALSATLSSDSMGVMLLFSGSFPVADPCVLSVQNVEDTTGNAMDSVVAPFIYYDFAIPAYRDLMINELMADPSPTAGLPEHEFVEVYNPTDSFFLLTGMFLADPSTTDTVPGFEFISPGEHIILCKTADTAAFAGYGKVIGLADFPSLNNAGDSLAIGFDSTTLDVVVYSDSWYGDEAKDDGGYTLEQVNPFNICAVALNWQASQAGTGGTPGAQNSVYNTSPDTVPPGIETLNVIAADTLLVAFSKTMDSASLMQAVYALNHGLTITSVTIVSMLFDEVKLGLSAPIDSALFYTLSITGVTDCPGHTLDGNTVAFALGVTPQPFDLVINELYPLPSETSGIPAVEFVELYNRTEKLLRLHGLRISDVSSSSTLQPMLLGPKEYVIVCDNQDTGLFDSSLNIAAVGSMPSLNNTDDRVALVRGAVVIDEVSYNESWYEDPSKAKGGYTLERISPAELCGLAANWTASQALAHGTPGLQNSVLDSTAVSLKPRLASAWFRSLNEVVLCFDKRMDSTSLATAQIHIGPFTVTASEPDEGNGTVVAVSSVPFERGKTYAITVGPVTDCAGATLEDGLMELYLHDSGDVVINEVLFNPRGSGSDFVELFNLSTHDINLQYWSLAYLDSKDSLRHNHISDTSLVLQAGGYLALNEDKTDILTNYPAAENLHETDLPGYANDLGSVMVYDQLTTLMDRFDYNEEMHFALIEEPDGVSLERLDARRTARDEGNWHSASSDVLYATPGYLNSQHYSGHDLPLSGFSLSEDYVSPDNDGYQDVININYNVLQPGVSATVRIYTDQGILIRTLESNVLLGTQGSITWDGTNDLGEKARTGIHLILVETFDLEGLRQQYRLPCVVAARLD